MSSSTTPPGSEPIAALFARYRRQAAEIDAATSRLHVQDTPRPHAADRMGSALAREDVQQALRHLRRLRERTAPPQDARNARPGS